MSPLHLFHPFRHLCRSLCPHYVLCALIVTFYLFDHLLMSVQLWVKPFLSYTLRSWGFIPNLKGVLQDTPEILCSLEGKKSVLYSSFPQKEAFTFLLYWHKVIL